MNVKSRLSRILIVDDEENQLAALRRTLHGQFDIVTTRDPIQALKIFELQGPFAVVISDYKMPVMNGIQLFSRIFEIDPDSQRILITGCAELQMAIDAVNFGKINAFLTKPTPNVSLRSVVQNSAMIYQELKKTECNNAAPSVTSGTNISLSVKEIEILQLLSKGLSNEEIAHQMHIKIGTVKSHVNSLFRKLDVTNRTKAVTLALEMGLIQQDIKH